MNIKMDFTLTPPSVPNFVQARSGETQLQIDVADLTDDQIEVLIVAMAQKLRENAAQRRLDRLKPPVRLRTEGRW